MNPLNLSTCPLSGSNLIEAGAGTGKTYTITGLFLRLILEEKLTIDRILVVTFTEAATEELRGRLLRRLQEALQAFSRGKSDDPFLSDLLHRHQQDPSAPQGEGRRSSCCPGRKGCSSPGEIESQVEEEGTGEEKSYGQAKSSRQKSPGQEESRGEKEGRGEESASQEESSGEEEGASSKESASQA